MTTSPLQVNENNRNLKLFFKILAIAYLSETLALSLLSYLVMIIFFPILIHLLNTSANISALSKSIPFQSKVYFFSVAFPIFLIIDFFILRRLMRDYAAVENDKKPAVPFFSVKIPALIILNASLFIRPYAAFWIDVISILILGYWLFKRSKTSALQNQGEPETSVKLKELKSLGWGILLIITGFGLGISSRPAAYWVAASRLTAIGISGVGISKTLKIFKQHRLLLIAAGMIVIIAGLFVIFISLLILLTFLGSRFIK